jgi:electron transfer flavoprotein beta subunit
MKIAVLIKQVPATDRVKMDEKTGTMVRSEIEAELNPLDMYAVEEAVRTKEYFESQGKQAEVTAISMGPPQAAESIKDAISMGCYRGILLTDRLFAGSDTFATALVLSSTIKKMGGFDIIFTGERATDGETGQVGPSVAAQLDIPPLTYVRKIKEISENKITVERAVENGRELIRAELPVLISVVKEINEPRIPTLQEKSAQRTAK